jgi:DeoR family fructose operon transcriptional repressor
MSFEHGFSSDNILVSQLSRAALLQTNEPYVLLDSSKINHPSYVNFASLDEVSAVVTDHKISKADTDAFAHCRPVLHIAD